jgi:hypothetical protein
MDMKQSKKYLTYVTRIILFSLVMYISCVNHTDKEKMQFPFVQEIEFDSSVNQISIENPTDSLINFRLYVNEKFWYTQEEILSAVEEIETDSLPGLPMDAAKAWVFVMENSFHYQEIYLEKEFAYQALNLFNSWGGAFCSHRNSALAQIWEWQGYQTRCIQLKGHIVSEIFYNEKWMMLDADYKRYYLNKQGQIADFTELEQEIAILDNKFHPKYLSIIEYLQLNHSDNYINHFLDENKNEINSWFKDDIPKIDEYISLPPQASLSFPIDTFNSSSYAFGKIQINGYFRGEIHCPFGLYTASCKKIEGVKNSFVQNQLNPPGDYFIEGENIKLLIAINPLIANDYIKNISVHSNNNSKIIIQSDYNQNISENTKEFLSIEKYNVNAIQLNYSAIPKNYQIKSDSIFYRYYLNLLQIDTINTPDSIRIKHEYFLNLLEESNMELIFYETINKNKAAFIIASTLLYLAPKEKYERLSELMLN